jgi:acyl-CoA synthetase (AMP-forming)/AMP-acid ligase II
VAIRPLRLGVTLPANEGEVWIRGPMLMSGYLAAPKENAAALHRGWFKTGDVGRLDAEGYLYISDRLKQIIVCDGVRISCAAVERAVLETHSAAEAAAFGIADEHRGERLVVVVAPYAGQSCDETQISQRLASSGFAASLAPRIVTLPALPRTSSGKIDRFELQRRVCASSSPQ